MEGVVDPGKMATVGGAREELNTGTLATILPALSLSEAKQLSLSL